MTDNMTPFDSGHPSVGVVPSWLATTVQTTPQGQLLVMTIRVPNSTLTIALNKADAEVWIRQIQADVDTMSSLILAPPGFQPPPMNGRVPKPE
jgi:hypothetical protein